MCLRVTWECVSVETVSAFYRNLLQSSGRQGPRLYFKVLDDSFAGTYKCKVSSHLTMWERDLIGDKLRTELSAGMISELEKTNCIHAMFVVPKDEGGGSLVVDCSQPKLRNLIDM